MSSAPTSVAGASHLWVNLTLMKISLPDCAHWCAGAMTFKGSFSVALTASLMSLSFPSTVRSTIITSLTLTSPALTLRASVPAQVRSPALRAATMPAVSALPHSGCDHAQRAATATRNHRIAPAAPTFRTPDAESWLGPLPRGGEGSFRRRRKSQT